jgi:probable DNA metabolism protein
MINYIYDGSFEGLLSAIYEAYYSDKKPDKIVPARDFIDNFLYTNIFIETDYEKYRKVYVSIQSKISDLALEHIYYAFLSETEDSSTFIYEYLRFGFKIGKAIDFHLTDQRVLNIHKAASKVTSENHRLLGLIRFKKIKGDVYYASIEPDHNVLSLLAPHFKDRLSDQRWIIHDLKRNLAAVYNKRNWIIEHLYSKTSKPFNASLIREVDMDFEDLWKLYFKHISIESKKNIKLQKQHMPKRYWYQLTEKKGI